MAHLLKTGAEAPPQKRDVILIGLSGFQKRVIGHEHGGGEIIGQRNARHGARLFAFHAGRDDNIFNRRHLFKIGELIGQLKRAPRLVEQFG